MARTVTLLGLRRGKDDSEALKNEIQNLDADKYIGTIGLAADKPTDVLKPHYTSFPADPDEGHWVRVVSETTIDSKSLLIGQEWICVTAPVPAQGQTPAKAAVWEQIQAGSKKPQFATYAECVGELTRVLDRIRSISIPTNQTTFVNLTTPVATGVFEESARTSGAQATDLSFSILRSVQYDFYVRIAFVNDLNGSRSADLTLFSYHPSGNNIYALPLERFSIDVDRVSSTAPIRLIRPNILLPLTDPIDELPITHAVAVSVQQTSGVALNLFFAELKVRAWK